MVIDEVGYIPFEAEAANLFFQLVAAGYERASPIVTSNKPFGAGVRCSATRSSPPSSTGSSSNADVVALKGDSYRLKDRDLGCYVDQD